MTDYLKYEYLREGFMNQYVMWFMVGLIIVLALVCLIAWRKKKKNLVKDLVDNRHIVMALLNKKMVGRYGNSYLGFLWNIIIPAIVIASICLVFTAIKDFYPGRNYCIYLCIGVTVVTMCRESLLGRSLRANGAMLKKMDTPGWIIVLSDTISAMILTIISILLLFIAIFAITGTIEPVIFVSLPILLPILFVFAFGCGLLFSIVTVMSDDIGNFVSAISRTILWITPTFYYLADSKDVLVQVSMWNPFTYFVETFHQPFSYAKVPDMNMVIASILITIVVLLIGALVYDHYIGKVRERV